MRRIFSYAFLFVCSTALAFGFDQESAKPRLAIQQDALDQLLADFAAATAKLDIKKAEKLFLPPDDTPAGKNRQAHLSELRKDWNRAKEGGTNEGPAVQFRHTKKVIRTQMLISGPGVPKDEHVNEVEFTVAFTKDGWKIVSMDAVANK